jgi:hypothetical protein
MNGEGSLSEDSMDERRITDYATGETVKLAASS